MTVDLKTGLTVLRCIARHSRSNPITGEAISIAVGVDTRVVAEVVSVAFEMGTRVAACSIGYYIPSDAEDKEYIAREKSRLISLGKKLSGHKKHSDNLLTLFEQDAA